MRIKLNVKRQDFFLTSILLFLANIPVMAQTSGHARYVLEHDVQVAKEQSGPHNGSGKTIGFSFFDDVADYHTAFKKRILKPGSSIGYHQQKEDEIYYVISGTGEMQMNEKTFSVKPGDAILTRTGSSHGIAANGEKDLVLIIVYEKKQDTRD